MENFTRRIAVKGLHGRISFDVSLNPDLNIIYGKNGLGKTTLLHIIANISDGDLYRFYHLNFSEIIIESNSGNILILNKNEGIVSVSLDGDAVFSYGGHVETTQSNYQKLALGDVGDTIRKIFGGRSCYLPAFRSVLERSREIYGASTEEARGPNYDELVRIEELIQARGAVKSNTYYSRDLAARNTALKTIRCRAWFGAMVPVIRYPSIADVAEGLSEEWSSANIRTSRLEQDQYEQAFLDIFEAILLERNTTSPESLTSDGDVGSQNDILSSISDLLNDETLKTRSDRTSKTYDRLLDIARAAGREGTKYNSVLEIYRKLLKTRKETREEAYKPLVDFEAAVNTFLDGKELRVGFDGDPANRRASRGERVRIYPDQGKSYPVRALSSGERQIATILFAASRSSVTPGSLLIDEPELSLHVDWQRHILKELIKQNPDRQIIACTHSPEVGADHKKSILFFRPTVFEASSDELSDEDLLGGDSE
ncbi:AAA family ATPase [Agrobacterium vitis]|uniref:AAA family ATPase n=1 Tax=Rhizobium/Agrobacterium group TaxID=227290 RepID=UPI00111353EF|nr:MULTISPECIES: AAA family ATPase [Rhizobium/Agrobacterium group]MCF1434589.1 AAA family ATPase [Allorhizobium ampelinum]MUO88460.1 AAA family ATPase [Agrobacterium vitis]MUZ54424.1 AAA family ATPase [Agrobacterium vitis]MUZ90386.1 AAA family ATPase [Agrobacterium vitis]MVA38998.1 AAA family ATPase [Agrobacterium vitis]